MNNQQIKQTEKIYSNAAQSMIAANYSERSIESMFNAEIALDDAMHSANKYSGMNQEERQQAMIDECNEIASENEIYDYYND
jgi:hypothetical protein